MAKPKKPPSHRSKAELEASRQRRRDIAADVAAMAKRANQRLRELEKHDLTKSSHAYRYVERLSYDKDSATAQDKKGRFKFNTNTRNKSYQELQHEKAELDRFLNSAKTSTVKGTLAQFEKAYQTYMANLTGKSGQKPLSRDEYGDMWRMRNMKKLKTMYGSSEAIKIVTKGVNEGLDMDEIDVRLDDMPADTTLIELEDMIADGEWHAAEGFNPFER